MEPSPILGNINDIVERTITIRNQGNGSVSNFNFSRLLGNGLTHQSYDFTAVTTWNIDAETNPNLIVFNGGVLKSGETIVFKEKVLINSCELFPTNYEVYYGCNEKCEISAVNGTTMHIINLDTPNAPNLQVTRTNQVINCFNQFGENTLLIKNTGNIATNAIEFEIGTQDLDGYVNPNGITVGGLPANIIGSTTANPKILKISVPGILPGASVEIKFQQYYAAPQGNANACSSAPTSFTNGQTFFNASYDFPNSCAAVSTGGITSNETSYNFSGEHVGEVDVIAGQPFNADYLFTEFSIPSNQLQVGDKFVITLELSEGLTASDFNFGAEYELEVLQGNKYEFTFVYGENGWNDKVLNFVFSRLQFIINLNCPTDLSDLWYKVGGELRKKNAGIDCTPVVFKCNETKLNGFCEKGTCENGLVNINAKLSRFTVGFAVHSNQAPNIQGILTNADLRTFLTGDVLEISQESIIKISQGSFKTVKLVVSKDSNISTLLVQNSGKVVVDGVEIINNLNVVESTNAYTLTYEFDANLQDNALVNLSIKIKANESSLGLKKFPSRSYLIDSVSGEEFICGNNYTASGFYVPNEFKFSGGTSDFVDCVNEENSATFSSLILGFSNQDVLFKNEFRELFKPTEVQISVPSHMTMTAVKVSIENQPWLGEANFIVENISAVSNSVYSLPINEILTDITGGRYLDEGFELKITPYVSLFECEPTSIEKTQTIAVTFNGIILDGEGLETPYTNTKELKYNTGFGSLKLETSNGSELGFLNEDGTVISWVIKIESSETRNFNSVWISNLPDSNHALEIKSVEKVDNYNGNTGLTVIYSEDGIYKLGDFDAKQPKYYLIKADVIDCRLESLKINYGYNCASNAYPNINNDGCVLEPKILKHKTIESVLQTEIVDQFNGNPNAKPNFCEGISYTVQLHNAGDTRLNELKIEIPLNDSPGLTCTSIQIGDVYHVLNVPSQPTTNITTFTTNVENNTLVITLPNEVALNTLERIRVKLNFAISSCDFRSGTKHTVKPIAKNNCGVFVTNITTSATKRMIIFGGSDAFPELREVEGSNTVSIDPVLTTSGVLRAVYNAEIINSGEFGVNDAITNDYKVAIKLPSGWSIVGDPNDYLFPNANVEYEGFNAERGYVYNITAPIAVAQSLKFNNVPLKYTLNDQTSLECNHNFGDVHILVYQNITVPTCNSGLDCTDKGIDQVLFENIKPMILPVNSALSIVPENQFPVICNPSVIGGIPTLADIELEDTTAVYHLDWYENEQEAINDLPANRLALNTPLVNGRTYYVINRFIVNGTCKSNIGKIKVTLKDNNLSGTVIAACDPNQQTYHVKVVLNSGTPYQDLNPYTVIGTGTPGNFTNNSGVWTWTSEAINSSTSYGVLAEPYNITFTDANNCSPLNFTGSAPVCCVLEIVCPENRIINFGDDISPSNTGIPQIKKACGNTLFTYTDSATSGCENGLKTFTRTFTVTDEQGNTQTCTQVISIKDITSPVIITPAQDIILQCGASNIEVEINKWLANKGGAIAVDNSSETVIWSNNYESTNFVSKCGTSGSVRVTFTATDACENTSTTTATFTIVDNQAPVFTTSLPTDVLVSCASEVPEQLTVTATDNCTASTEIAIEVKDVISNVSASCANNYTITRTYKAIDACGNENVHTQIITVSDTIKPVFTKNPVNKIVECDGKGNLEGIDGFNAWLANFGGAEASDNCGNTTITYIIEDTNTICGGAGTIIVDFIATDSCGNFTIKQATYAIFDTTKPVVTPAKDLIIECSVSSEDELNAWLSTNGGATASDTCGLITWTNNYSGQLVACGNAVTVTFTATDSCGNASTTQATVKLVDTIKPVLNTTAQSLTVSCGTNTEQALNNWLANNAGAKATDLCSSVTWTNNYLPENFTTTCGTSGSVRVIFTATDACGNSIPTEATFTIEDKTAPIISLQAQNKTVSCDGSGNIEDLNAWLASNGGAQATDGCSAVTWEHNFTTLSDLCGSTGTATVIFTATDACNNSSTTSATFTIVDTQAPVFTTLPQNQTVECGPNNTIEFEAWLANNANGIAEDICSEVTYSYSVIDTVVLCGNTNKTVVHFTATDSCGNKVSKQATFTIQDTTGPEITLEASNKVVECNGTGNISELNAWLNTNAGASATDLCGTVTWSNNFTGLTATCGLTGNAEVIFTATDSCGNSSQTIATFTIVDTTAPVFVTNLPKDRTIECSDSIPEVSILTADDSCSKATVSFSENRVDGSCDNNYQLVRTWTATDACGNTTEHVQTITVQDTTAPVFVGTLPASEIFIKCEDLKSAEVLVAEDNCSEATVVSFDEKIEGECVTKYDILRTWVATDSCGNESTFTQLIHLSCQIEVFNGVTPDGDGFNDELVLNGIECYPGNSVEIFNRWGVLVYETKNYNSNGNSFKGYSEGRATFKGDSKLPTGTYYYIIKYSYDLGNSEVYPIEQAGFFHLEAN